MRYIYVIQAQHHAVKIGVAGNPAFRLKELQTGCPFKLSVFARFKVATARDAYKLETAIHKRLGRHALEGEWFKIEPAEAVAVITSVVAGAPKNKDAEIELQATREFRRKACNRILVCPKCQHTKQTTLDNKTIWRSKFRCTVCNSRFEGRRFFIRRVA